ncbi:MAG: ribonuclease HII [Ignavibacteriaceae bacterium]|nr:ribonuclease HII [Ignavibacterium sp.]MCC6253343.1 ribonuclease HII [Ignavibacteriaceae bacterium]HMN23201.1 ribonuclease HII [Ignavibacteriaceae bacterium]HRN26774.1 ribonuclease HII [Ignavibacteriaceae bacterium]HRP92958.1 ribonuclease HII [Ignavibacteriaceae bacterium]
MKNIDKKFLAGNKKYLAGTDEAGRGPLAGPVVAAAVILPNDFYDERINDSKKLSAKLREELFVLISKNALAYSYTVISHKKIDEINILKASLLAMKTSVKKLKLQPQIILIDGNKSFTYDAEVIPIVKGDSKSLSIASASIIAKVVRDRIMMKLAKKYPNYCWETNKGYPTAEHINAVLKFGACSIHRKTFLKKIYERANQTELLLVE